MTITEAALRPVVDAIQVPTDLLVAGVWRPAGSGRRLEVSDPATGTVLASVADADPSDAEAAVGQRLLPPPTGRRQLPASAPTC